MNEIRIFKGDDFADQVTIIAIDDDSVETAVNLTGYTCFFTAKRSTKDADAQAIIRKTWTSHTNPTSGITTITLDPSDTALVGDFHYDFGYVAVDGKKKTLWTGKLYIEQNVTNEVE